MPSFPPRKDTTKKQDQLLKKEAELIHAIRINSTNEKLIKVAEKYKAAQIALLKAKLHVIKEKELQKRVQKYNVSKIEAEKELWTNKTIEEILDELKNTITHSTA